MRNCKWSLAAGAVLVAAGIATGPAFALEPYSTPTLSCVSAGENKLTIKIQAGSTGAPAGFSLQWIPKDLFDALGGWPESSDPRLCKLSLSGQPSLNRGASSSSWSLGANEPNEVTIGDINFDETGVSGSNCGVDLLECGTEYVFRAFAHAGRRMGRSAFTSNLICSTLPCPPEDCTRTQGYWKNHPEAWPVKSLALGTNPKNPYSQAQLLTILNTSGGGQPCPGNGVINLAHQLIAAKLNVALGATCKAAANAIAAADNLIGNLNVTTACVRSRAAEPFVALALVLDDFNNGILAGCPAHCENGVTVGVDAATPVEESTWGKVKIRYR